MIDLTTKSGKYRIIMDREGKLEVYRNNQPWMTQVKGSKMLIELCVELDELRCEAKRLTERMSAIG